MILQRFVDAAVDLRKLLLRKKLVLVQQAGADGKVPLCRLIVISSIMTLPQAGTLIDPRPGGELNAVFAGEGEAYKYAVAQKDGDVRALVKELNAALSGRGGGKPAFAQGSVSANRAQIEAFFYSYFGK